MLFLSPYVSRHRHPQQLGYEEPTRHFIRLVQTLQKLQKANRQNSANGTPTLFRHGDANLAGNEIEICGAIEKDWKTTLVCVEPDSEKVALDRMVRMSL